MRVDSINCGSHGVSVFDHSTGDGTRAAGVRRPLKRAVTMLVVAAVAVTVLSVVGGLVGTASADDVTGCTTIQSSGTYNLTTDINNAGEEVCINISSSDVIFDGGGHVVDDDESGNLDEGILVNRGFSNVTVRNVTVTDWTRAGIRYDRSDGRITEVNASENIAGIVLRGTTADPSVDNNTLQRNLDGVQAGDARGATIKDNEFSGNFVGIGMQGASASLTIESNTMDLDGTGIALQGQRHAVVNNTIRSPSTAGIRFRKGFTDQNDDVRIEDNTITGSSGDGIALSATPGVGESADVVLLRSVTIRNNTLTGSEGNEITARNASDLTIAENTVSGPGGDGIVLVNVTTLKLRDNDIDKDADVVGTTILNSTDVLVEDDRLDDHGGDKFANIYVNGTDSVTVRNVTVTDNEKTRPRIARAIFVNSSTDVTVEKSQITIDQQDDSVDIRNSESVSVLNNHINESGIRLESSNDGTVRGNTVESDSGDFTAVTVYGSESVTVDDNRLDNNQRGVSVGFGAKDVTVTNNRINDSLRAGITVARGAPNTNINDNTVRVADGTRVFETFNTSEVTVRNLEAGNLTGDTTTLDFAAENVTVRTVASRPAPPSGENDIGIYINASNTGSNNFPAGTDQSYLDLTIEYDDADAQNVEESSLSLWRNNASGWTDIGGTVDENANTVSKNITDYSVFAPLASQEASTGGGDDGDDSDDGPPEITNYEVTADGDEVTVSFDSDENLVEIEVAVSGPEDATLTREDFSGDRFAGFEATYQAGEDGDYTLELVTAKDADNDDGAEEGTFSGTTSIDTGDGGSADDGTATPTDNKTATPAEDSTDQPDDETTTPADDSTDQPDDETAAPADDSTDQPDDETTTTEEDGPGFGPMGAVVALLAGAVLLARRR